MVDKKIKVDKYPDSYMKLYPDSDRFNEDGWHEIIDLSDYSTIPYDPSNEKLATIYIRRQEKENVS